VDQEDEEVGEMKDVSKNKKNGKILGNGKKPEKNFFKKKKVKEPLNRKKCVEAANGKCRDCGSQENVSAHHIIFKGEQGDDSPDNLVALCFSCHRKAHDGYYTNLKYVTAKEYIIDLLERIDPQFYREKIEERKRR